MKMVERGRNKGSDGFFSTEESKNRPTLVLLAVAQGGTTRGEGGSARAGGDGRAGCFAFGPSFGKGGWALRLWRAAGTEGNGQSARYFGVLMQLPLI